MGCANRKYDSVEIRATRSSEGHQRHGKKPVAGGKRSREKPTRGYSSGVLMAGNMRVETQQALPHRFLEGPWSQVPSGAVTHSSFLPHLQSTSSGIQAQGLRMCENAEPDPVSNVRVAILKKTREIIKEHSYLLTTAGVPGTRVNHLCSSFHSFCEMRIVETEDQRS